MRMFSAKLRDPLPLLVQDTTDSDNQLSLAGFLSVALNDLSSVTRVRGIYAVSPRHADLSYPHAFNPAIAGNRPDFRAFEPTKNSHEGTGTVSLADQKSGLVSPEATIHDADMVLRSEIRRTYWVIMKSLGFDPNKKECWELMLRTFPCIRMPLPREHLMSHHYFAREFLFDRRDLCGGEFGSPLCAKDYNRIVSEIDGEVAVTADGAYDRDADVRRGLASSRRERARAIIQSSLDKWDEVLGVTHKTWIDDCESVSAAHLGVVTDVIVMAPCTLQDHHWQCLRNAKRLWGMFFALDNAAEYGHWIVEEKAKNIFRNNFNTALDEDGAILMLKYINHMELRAHFHPTELFKGDLGHRSWEGAKELVKDVYECPEENLDPAPLLGLYNCYNCAKSPKGDPQQISDPLTIFEYLNFSARHERGTNDASFDPSTFMPVASYSPALIMDDQTATERNYQAACESALSKGIEKERVKLLVRKEKVFVVKLTYEPLNNGVYVGHGLVARMLPEYKKWLTSLLTAKPPLSTPNIKSVVVPVMDAPRAHFMRTSICDAQSAGGHCYCAKDHCSVQ